MPRSDRETRRLARRVVLRVDAHFRDFGRRFESSIEPRLGELVGRFETKDVATEIDQAVRVLLRTFGWDADARRFLSFVRPVLELVGAQATDAVGAELGIDVSFDLFARRALLDDVGARVVDVSTTSRNRLARLVGDGISKGLSVEQIVRGVPPGTENIRGPVPAFAGIRGLVDSWLSTGTGRILGPGVSPTGSRSYLIALTETATAWNTSALATYQGSGIGLVEVFDGADCGWSSHNDPDLAAGSIRTVDQARAKPIAHPRCQRAFGAAVNASKTRPSPLSRAPASDPREATLASVEDRIRDNPTETAVVVGRDGRVLLDKTEGSATAVHFSRDELSLFRGSTMTHNHPASTSFSRDDVSLAIEEGIEEMRVTSRLYDYSMRLPKGADLGDLREAAFLADQEVASEFWAAIRAGTMSKDAANAAHWHEVWTRFASRVAGVAYRRTAR